MDYEKKYKEALEKAKKFYNELAACRTKQKVAAIFPELAESEDERIREFLIDLLSHGTWKKDWPLSPAECVAWLEKQKEQKPVEIHIDNPNIEKFDPDVKITTSDSSADRKVYCEEVRDAFEPNSNINIPEKQAEWSEEDEKTINNACCWIAEYAGYLMDKNYSKASMLMSLTDKLKSLRPQPQGIYQQVVKRLRDMCDRYEQNGMFTDERARDFLGNVRVKCKDAIECAPILDEPHWKPSEEQMGR